MREKYWMSCQSSMHPGAVLRCTHGSRAPSLLLVPRFARSCTYVGAGLAKLKLPKSRLPGVVEVASIAHSWRTLPACADGMVRVAVFCRRNSGARVCPRTSAYGRASRRLHLSRSASDTAGGLAAFISSICASSMSASVFLSPSCRASQSASTLSAMRNIASCTSAPHASVSLPPIGSLLNGRRRSRPRRKWPNGQHHGPLPPLRAHRRCGHLTTDNRPNRPSNSCRKTMHSASTQIDPVAVHVNSERISHDPAQVVAHLRSVYLAFCG